jgi:polyisoprenoid-binding protein YceI
MARAGGAMPDSHREIQGAFAMHQPLVDATISAETVGETLLPLPVGRWKVDPATSGVLFVARQMGLFSVRGHFDRFDATLDVGPTLADIAVIAEVDLTSVDTNNARRDAHLRSGAYFDVEKQPTMMFRSTAVGYEDGSYWLGGDLTIANATRPLMLDVEFHGAACSRVDQRCRASFVATGEVRRRDFGLDAARFVVGDKVTIELDAQFVACDDTPTEPNRA